jgi:hypothetical protein
MIELIAINEETLILESISEERKSVSSIYKERKSEGVFKLLIHKHLLDDEIKFKAYFRFTREQFYNILHLVEDDLTEGSSNRVITPILPDEKLALTLAPQAKRDWCFPRRCGVRNLVICSKL